MVGNNFALTATAAKNCSIKGKEEETENEKEKLV
jgi:hypothetical protein